MLASTANSVMDVKGVRYLSEKQQGLFPYEPGKGFVLARGPNGEVDFFVKGYIRYLNQLGLDRFYTDAFGRTTELDLRQDIQLNRLQWGLHGWLFDPRFRYFWYAWTQNVSQGDPAQVVVGGNIAYKFDDALTATAGILAAFNAIDGSVIPELAQDRPSIDGGSVLPRIVYPGIHGERRAHGYPGLQSGPRRQSQRPWRQRKPVG